MANHTHALFGGSSASLHASAETDWRIPHDQARRSDVVDDISILGMFYLHSRRKHIQSQPTF
jgi:hypothetical protein